MGLWNSEFGGALFEGTLPPEFVNTFRIYDQSLQQVDAAGANNRGTYVLEANDSSSPESLLRYLRPEDFDDLTDTDQLILVSRKETASFNFFGLWSRASGALNTEAGYFCGVSSTTLTVYEYTAGTATSLATYTHGLTISQDSWYWLQFRNEGTSLKARLWAYGATPPAHWQIDDTDSTHTAAGWVGPGKTGTTRVWYDWYSLGTEGEAAAMFDRYPANEDTLDNTINSFPSTIATDGTSFLVYVGQPYVAVDWSLTGDGTLQVITDYTDAGGRAYARYEPGTVGTKVIEVTVGV